MEKDHPTSTPSSPQVLYLHEWLALLVLISFLALIFIISFDSRKQTTEEPPLPHSLAEEKKQVEIQISGAVERPGGYRVSIGTTLKEVLQLAMLKPDSDLGRLKLETKLKRNRHIHIRTRSMITVHIEGAVKEAGKRTIPKRTRMRDLVKYLEFDSDADLEKVLRSRVVRDEEEIYIPRKGEKNTSAVEKCCEKTSTLITSLL